MSSGLAVLQFNELSIGAFRMLQQFFMAANISDLSIFKEDYFVCLADCRYLPPLTMASRYTIPIFQLESPVGYRARLSLLF